MILLFSDWSIPNLNDQAYCQATCKALYTSSCSSASYRRVQSDCSFSVSPWSLADTKLCIGVKHRESIEMYGKRAPRDIKRNVTSRIKINYCIPARQLDVLHFPRLSSAGVRGWLRETSLVPRLSLSFSLFRACEFYTQKIEGEGEPGTEPCSPVATWPWSW